MDCDNRPLFHIRPGAIDLIQGAEELTILEFSIARPGYQPSRGDNDPGVCHNCFMQLPVTGRCDRCS